MRDIQSASSQIGNDRTRTRDLEQILPRIASSGLPVIAGPCAIESPEQFDRISAALASRQITYLRGGAFKHRTEPHSFRGLGQDGLKAMAEIVRPRNQRVVSEILDVRDLDAFGQFVDLVMIGARSMRNYTLVEAAASLGKPLILKRDLSATVKEWLGAAEYAVRAGAQDVILCERGVRWCDPQFRNLLDLAAVAWLREHTEFFVIVDPSHATGDPSIIPRVSRAAMACGAHGLILEVHDRPEEALCDGPQALTLDAFDHFLDVLAA